MHARFILQLGVSELLAVVTHHSRKEKKRHTVSLQLYMVRTVLYCTVEYTYRFLILIFKLTENYIPIAKKDLIYLCD